MLSHLRQKTSGAAKKVETNEQKTPIVHVLSRVLGRE